MLCAQRHQTWEQDTRPLDRAEVCCSEALAALGSAVTGAGRSRGRYLGTSVSLTCPAIFISTPWLRGEPHWSTALLWKQCEPTSHNASVFINAVWFFFPQAGQILKNVLMSLLLSLMVLEDSTAQTPALGLDFRNKMESFSDLNISNSSGRSWHWRRSRGTRTGSVRTVCRPVTPCTPFRVGESTGVHVTAQTRGAYSANLLEGFF